MAASDWKQNVETYSSAREARQNEVQKRSEAVPGKSSAKKTVLENFPKFTGKHLCRKLFLKKFQAVGCSWRLILKSRVVILMNDFPCKPEYNFF